MRWCRPSTSGTLDRLAVSFVFVLLLGHPTEGACSLIAWTDLPQAPAERAVLQAQLETKLVRERLRVLGLTPEEIDRRLELLDAGELHVIATQLDGLQAGGEVATILMIVGGLVLASLLIVLIAGAMEDLSVATGTE